jgi:hypothetical protein
VVYWTHTMLRRITVRVIRGILRLDYRPRDLVAAALAEAPVAHVPRRGSLLLWYRLTGTSRPRGICLPWWVSGPASGR